LQGKNVGLFTKDQVDGELCSKVIASVGKQVEIADFLQTMHLMKIDVE